MSYSSTPSIARRLGYIQKKLRKPALEKLDTQYYGCPDDLRELLPLYVARHPDEFRHPGSPR